MRTTKRVPRSADPRSITACLTVMALVTASPAVAATAFECGPGGRPDADAARCTCPEGKHEETDGAGVSRCVIGAAPPTASPSPPPLPAPPPVAPPPTPTLKVSSAYRPSIAIVRPLTPLTLRKKALLVNELAQLEKLLEATPKTSPDRPALLRRTMEDYRELALVAQAEGSANAPALAAKARERAIARGLAIVSDHPLYAKLDEVLYVVGIEQQMASNLAGARAAHLDLIKRFPQSRYATWAYVAFGDAYFAEAKNDASKYAIARAAYGKATNVAHGAQAYALVMTAFCTWLEGEATMARAQMERARDFAASHPAETGATAAKIEADKALSLM